MLQCIKQQPRLFLSLFGIPLLFHLVVWQFCIVGLAAKSYESWLPYLPVRACLAVQGLIWGGAGGLVSVLVALLMFSGLAKSMRLQTHPVLYANCWLIPFCLFGFFGSAMCSAPPGANPPLTASQSLVAGLYGLTAIGSLGGAIGILAFAGLQSGIQSGAGTTPKSDAQGEA